MFKHGYLTVRVSPGDRGWKELNPHLAAGCDGGACSDVTCQACSASCAGKDSIGGFIADPEEEIELVLDLNALRSLVRQAEKIEQQEGR